MCFQFFPSRNLMKSTFDLQNQGLYFIHDIIVLLALFHSLSFFSLRDTAFLGFPSTNTAMILILVLNSFLSIFVESEP